ncbi:iron chelate uptake ABC transporter family permease subunit [Spirochaeta lutea]|uniref:Iron ABC transporter permease n=1 Tax=Spirochaeta lutea TaxID=1480694 RepID=A0A098QWU1_9SPIO|nr:iron chelate uptake ABC transporter family permease subunit [Spirochaeta lutea]KGE70962.1 hypothetical protein DC28_13570 [Spirochaeta lutea]
MTTRHARLLEAGLVLLIIAAGGLSLAMGSSVTDGFILVYSRLPRLLALVLSGAGVSLAGLVMQKISRNPFASGETAGTMDFAALGYVLALGVFRAESVMARLSLAFIGAMIGTSIFFLLLRRLGRNSVLHVPLLGIMLGFLVNGLTQILAYRFDLLQGLSSWMFADFSLVIAGRYEFLFLVVPVVAGTWIMGHHLTIAGLGEDMATNLGSNFRLTRNLGLVVVSIMSALVVVIAGRIPFLGLIVPNLILRGVSDNVRAVLPLTALSGAVLLLISDISGRLIIQPYEIPVGLTMGVVGGGVFLVMLSRWRGRQYG